MLLVPIGIINACNPPAQLDGVLENESQESVYTSTTHEVVDSVLAGINGTVFCYGQVSMPPPHGRPM